jgi:N-acetylneuraminic acid mutarotase
MAHVRRNPIERRTMKLRLDFVQGNAAEPRPHLNQYALKRPASLTRWVGIAATAVPLLAIGLTKASAMILVTNGFNSATSPAGWATEVVANTGGGPAITFVTSSTSPTALPYEGSHFVKFNSFTCLAGSQVRLKQTASFSTLGYNPVILSFAWFQSNALSSDTSEGLTIEWSTDGATWNNGSFYPRYSGTASGWQWMQYSLPSAALNQATVYMAFLLYSQHGYNCYLDDVLVNGTPFPLITSVTPPTGGMAGGSTVTISGFDLGNQDVTNVTLCGIPASILTDNSPTQIVVVAGTSPIGNNGNVVLGSASSGVAVMSNAYSYLPPAPNASVATNATVNSFYANWSAVSGATNYMLDVSTADSFTSSFPAYTNVNAGNATTIWVSGLNAGTTYYYRVRCQQNGATSGNSQTITAQTLAGWISVSNGPASGGNRLTITGTGMSSGSDITNVTICGVGAVVQSQATNSVTVILCASEGGTGDIKIYSANRGVTTFVNGYAYNPPGHIFGPFVGWNSVSNLPAARSSSGVASVNGKIYVVGGYDGTSVQSTVYAYDTAQPSQGWLGTNSPLTSARSDLGAASVNGKIYAIGGYDGSSAQSTVYVYDIAQPSHGWLTMSNLPAARRGLAAAGVSGKIYAVGGSDGTNYQSTVYIYDPSQPTLGWLSVSNLPTALELWALATVNGKIYASGGFAGGWESTAYVYDPSQPAAGWLSVSNLPADLWGPTEASVNGIIFFMGGQQPYSSTAYAYDPSQPTLGWSSANNLPTAHGYMGAAGVNGQIYAFGGEDTLYPYNFSTAEAGSFSTGVLPSSGTASGGCLITITGNYLGNGDVTSVTLCGVPATILEDNSPTQVVVGAGAAALPGNGNVVVNSTTYGVIVASNAYTYLPRTPNAAAATNVTLNSFYANWSVVNGATNYLLDVSAVNDFTSCVAGYTNLTVGNVTTFWINGLNAGTTYYYRVRCQQNGFTSDSSPANSAQTLNGSMSVSSGPAAGGNTLTISGTRLGNGSDITNVTICGMVAVIQNQTANSVTVMVAPGSSGTGDINLYSSSLGVTKFVNRYTYNPAGAIFGQFTGWSNASNLPAGCYCLAAATMSGKICAVGGDYFPSVSSTVSIYDPAQPTLGWLCLGDLPTHVTCLAAASASGKIYAMGGYNGASGIYESAVLVYDPAQPSLGWLSVSNLPMPVTGLAAASVNGKIYTMGGYNGTAGDQSGAYVYDPSQPTLGWLAVSNLPAAREYLAAASVNGKIYAIGGADQAATYSTVYVYDPAQPAQGWLTASNLPAVSRLLAATSVNGKLYAMGGYDGIGDYESAVYVYDPSQPSLGWLSVSNLPTHLCGLAAAGAAGNIYAIGGYDDFSYQSAVYEGSMVPDVTPSSGPLGGGNIVTINGNDLGGGDVTSVTLCGIPANLLADNTPTQVVIRASAASTTVIGNVVVNSTSYGVTVKSNAYSYLPLPIITTSNPLPSGMVGAPYSQTLTASGGATPYTWAITDGGLPPGLNLSTNGLISGTPTLATSGSFTAQVADNSGLSATEDFNLTTTALMIMTAFDGTHLQLSWPTNCLGCELQAQTNTLGAGLGTNWVPIATSIGTNQLFILINPKSPSVFYRLRQQ